MEAYIYHEKRYFFHISADTGRINLPDSRHSFCRNKKTDKQPLYPLFFVLYSLYSPHSDDNSCHLLRNTLVGRCSCRTYRCSPLCPQRQKPHNSGIGIMYDCIYCGILSLILYLILFIHRRFPDCLCAC